MTTIYLSGDSVPALDDPQFIIKKGATYYVTRAVWEYTFDDAETDDERTGCTQIANEFNDLGDGADLVARQRDTGPGGGGGVFPNQTKP